MEKRALFRTAALEKLASPDQLDHTLTLVTARDGLVLLAVLLGVVGLLIWGIFGTWEITTQTTGFFIERPNIFEGVLYVPLPDAVKIQAGMRVYVTVTGIPTPTYGYLLAQVKDIIRSTNDQTMLVYIAPEKADDGFVWTRGTPPPVPLRADMPIEALIVLQTMRPLEILFYNEAR
jgi:hypothetical protein